LIKNNAQVGAKIALELSKLKRNQVLVIGGSAVDIIASPSALISGTSNPGKIEQNFGGVGRNIAECLGRLDVKPHFISVVGKDFSASNLVNHAKSIGIVRFFPFSISVLIL
jgi:sugar/nucleoside kinase (ribokinase family)